MLRDDLYDVFVIEVAKSGFILVIGADFVFTAWEYFQGEFGLVSLGFGEEDLEFTLFKLLDNLDFRKDV